MAKRFKIIAKGGGTPTTTADVRVVDADTGEDIEGIVSAVITMDAGEPIAVDLTFLNPELDIELDVEDQEEDTDEDEDEDQDGGDDSSIYEVFKDIFEGEADRS